MKLFFKLAVKEIFDNRKFSLFFVLNMAFGLTGFIVISAFSTSFDNHMKKNLKEILTADFMIVSSRPLSKEEDKLTNKVLGEKRKESRQITFYSMVKGKKQSKLSRIVAIDKNFPLYGTFHTDSSNSENINESIQRSKLVLTEKDTALFLGTEKGGKIRIGNAAFSLNSFVSDSDRSLTSIEFAPKIFIGIEQLKYTGLLKYGSRARYIRYYTYPKNYDTKSLVKKLNIAYSDFYKGEPQITVVDESSAGRRLGRVLGNFTGYLGLVATGALFLAGISTAYLFRGFLNRKLKEIAILMSLGAKRSEAFLKYIIQLVFLGVLASILSLGISVFLLPLMPVMLEGILPGDLEIYVNPAAATTALLLGAFGSLLFCLPVVVKVYNVKPLTLLREISKNGSMKTGIITAVSSIPVFTAFFILSVYLLNSLKKGLFFSFGFIIVTLFFAAAGFLIFNFCRYFSKGPVAVKIAFRNLFRNKLSSVSCFVTIAMGVFLISMIPQIQSGLTKEIERPDGLKIPSFFLMDLQDSQVKSVKEYLDSKNYALSNLSPVVTGRVISVNGEGFFKRRDKFSAKKRRYRRVEYIFSSREKLADSENIIEGKPFSDKRWDESSEKPFEVSLARMFAERNRIKVGDLMDFEIQGIPFTGKVINIRKVRWNSFQPNFYILFQKGVLESAPKTYLASVTGVRGVDRTTIKNELFEKFSNVSVFDVTKTIEDILGITDRLSLTIKFMAYLAILAGLVSIFSIAGHEARKHEKEINLLKVLGSGFNQIRKITAIEFGFTGLSASLFAAVLSIAFSFGISWYFFGRAWAFKWEYLVLIVISTTIVCVMTALLAAERVIRKKASTLLSG